MHVNLQPVYEKARPGDIRDSVSAITAAKKAFGYQTRYSLEDGLKETIPWFHDRKNRHSSN
jgi:nucleoside-diphosphate-sugar epimerase